MLFQNTFNGFSVECAFIPKTVSFFLNLLGIELGQYFFQFKHHLLTVAMVEHFKQVQLNWIQCSLFGIHGILVFNPQKYKNDLFSAR